MKYIRITITIKKVPSKVYFEFAKEVDNKIKENQSTKGTFRYKIHKTDAGWTLENCNITLAGDRKRIKEVRDSITALVKPRYRGGLFKRYIIKFSKIEEKEGTSINLDSDL